MSDIPSEIIDFYTQSCEEGRLQQGLGPLEFLRNKDLISRYLYHDRCVIADVGGGTGHYAQWLSCLGHQVILIDPVQKHIHQALKRSKRSARPYRCVLGEARQLPLDNHSADVVILHGPLYHLLEQEQRLAALKEARRVLRIGGVVLGFAITHASFVLPALQNGLIHEPEIYEMCLRELHQGEHYPPCEYPGMLAPAYLHRPSILVQEFQQAGFSPLHLLAVEGIVWLDKHYFESWGNLLKRQKLLNLVKSTEADHDLLSLSPHIMLAAEAAYVFP